MAGRVGSKHGSCTGVGGQSVSLVNQRKTVESDRGFAEAEDLRPGG